MNWTPHPTLLPLTGQASSLFRQLLGNFSEEHGRAFGMIWMLVQMQKQVSPYWRDELGGHGVVFVFSSEVFRRY